MEFLMHPSWNMTFEEFILASEHAGLNAHARTERGYSAEDWGQSCAAQNKSGCAFHYEITRVHKELQNEG